MTIAERINLHRCGYTRAEIDALAKEEKEARAEEASTASAQAETTSTTSAQAETTSTTSANVENDPVLEAIKGLTAAIQASNINKDTQPPAKTETMTDMINQL